MRVVPAIVMGLAFIVACGSGTVQGSMGAVGGEAFRAVDAMGAVRGSSSDGSLRIDIVDQPNLCATVPQAWYRRNAHRLGLGLADVATPFALSAPAGPGTYTVTSPAGGPFTSHSAFADARTTDQKCAVVSAHSGSGTGGTVTLTKAGPDSYVGTFDITLDTGDRLTGSFDAPNCPAIGGAADGGTCG